MFLSDFNSASELLAEHAEFNDEFWQQIMLVKSAINKELERKRADKAIGSGLSAVLTLYCDNELFTGLARLENELRFAFIVSSVELMPIDEAPESATSTEMSGLKITINSSAHTKCDRCWHHSETVGSNSDHPEICPRCVENIDGAGEHRKYA